MNTNTISRAFKSFVFNRVFFAGFVTGFIVSVAVTSLILGTAVSPFWGRLVDIIVGTFTGFIGNYFWERHQKKKRGTVKPYSVSGTGDIITLVAEMPNTKAAQTVVTKVIEITTPPDL